MHVYTLSDLKVVQKNIHSLHFSFEEDELDLTVFEDFSKIKNLSLNLPNVNKLDLSPLGGLGNLERLDIDGRIEELESGLSPLSTSKNLSYLGLGLAVESLNLNQLGYLDSLEVIDIEPKWGLKNFRLSPLQNLKWLRLWRANISSLDLSPISQIENIHTIELIATALTELNLEPLEEISSITTLNLTKNQFLSDLEISPLVFLANLRNLHLDPHVSLTIDQSEIYRGIDRISEKVLKTISKRKVLKDKTAETVREVRKHQSNRESKVYEIERVYLEDIDSFADALKVSPNVAQATALDDVYEDDVKDALIEIIGERFTPSHSSVEKSDLYTSQIKVREKPMSAAFLLKSMRGAPKTMNMRTGLGTKSNQILRLAKEPASFFVVQHTGEISTDVIEHLEGQLFMVANQRRQKLYYYIMDGNECAKILLGYDKLK